MSKIWHKPIDDKIFKDISSTQWMYYAHMISQDERESVEKTRDFVEYHARFLDNESVEKIQRARKEEKSNVPSKDELFNDFLKSEFGRPVKKE